MIDASIDHASLERMQSFEDVKFSFLESLVRRGDLGGLLAFSSGVVEFDDAHICTAWHRRYKQLKLRLEGFAASLACRAYCPRLFVVIGPRSFEAPATGWVDVVRQACRGASVGMAKPDEPRSWVAESYLRVQLDRFLDGNGAEDGGAPLPGTPLNGAFTLGGIARFAAREMGRQIAIEPREVAGWLMVPYVSRSAPVVAPEYSLERTLSPLVAQCAAELRSDAR